MADRKRHEGTVPEEGTVPAKEPVAEEGTVPEQGTVPDLEQRLEALAAERDEYLNDLKRVAAEFENYRKRAARDQADFALRANERLVKELLPVLDDLGRALEAAEKHEEAAAKPPVRERGPVEGARGNREVPPASDITEGVRLVHRQLAELLRKEGLAEIETDGKFDPHVHEALLTQPSEAPEGSVIDVVQKGYRLGDRVLRPARVVVAAAPPEVNGGDSP
jgi:molecular chaperone GrpE